jgi:phenylacetate-CoA ligase
MRSRESVSGRTVIDLDSRERDDARTRSAMQWERLRRLLAAVQGRNPFYTRKFADAGLRPDRLRSVDDLPLLPLTTKQELVADQAAHLPWGTALTEPVERYTRYWQTSSTTGRPLRWLDTNESWQWVLECWKAVFRAAGVGAGDRVFFPFSFGPFLGFWSAFEAACQIGAQAVPGGGMSTELRLATIDAIGPTAVCCTPTYALRLAEVAARSPGVLSRPLHEMAVRVVIVAGEPGGSIPATRERIEQGWGARVIDHHGLTEVGPVSFECLARPGGLHLNESEYICEVLRPGGDLPVQDGEPGELVVTNLGRTASPVIRYRTGDIVMRRPGECACGRTYAWLEGGIIGRADDMIAVRGVNVYPAAIEAVIRRFPEVQEFRSTVRRRDAMRALSVEIELDDRAAGRELVPARVASALRAALGLTVPVASVETGSLPRFEMKARRFVVEEA